MRSRSSGAARAWCAALGVLTIAVGLPGVAHAQSSRVSLNTYTPGTMGIPQPEPLITLSVKQPRSLARVLYEIFKQSPYEYQLLADVGTTAFTLEANKLPLTQALTQLFQQEKRTDPLVYSFQKSLTGKGGTFIVDREYVEIGVVEGEKKVSLANARITRVLPELFRLMNVPGRVEPNVPPVTVSVQLRPDEWEHVLPQLMLEAVKKEPALTYSKDGETWVVHVQKTPTGGPGSPLPSGTAPRRVRLALADTPLPDALRQLFQGSGWKYQLADKVGSNARVTYTSNNEPELAALHQILKAASMQGQQITYREGNGVLYIEEGPLPGQFQVARAGTAVRRTSLNLQQRRIKQVAEIVGGALGAKINVAPNVPDIPISVKLEQGTIEEWIQEIVRAGKESLPNLNFRAQGGGYVIELGK